MDIQKLRMLCLSHRGAEESFPFGNDTLVFKVRGKIFALMPMEPPLSINLKCDPEKAMDLRERYSAVTPGYHMNKVHWNTVMMDESIPSNEIRNLIDHSYELIVKSLKKTEREELEKAN